jgi:hypothetical protein
MKGGETMKKFLSKSLALFASSTMFLYSFVPAMADSTITVTGNGSSSANSVDLSTTTTNSLVQNNSATICNNVTSNATSGDNTANSNTGGDVGIGTGNASSLVSISTAVNKNIASMPTSYGDPTTVNINNNGSLSTNQIDLDLINANSAFQTNMANIGNMVNTKANSGHNNANSNTGGDVQIMTGNAQSEVGITNKANVNIANLGINNSSDNNISAQISGNGASSYNNIDLDQSQLNSLVQDNYANIWNSVHTDVKSGFNHANSNTNGDVIIDTGSAVSLVDIGNKANFNFASLGGNSMSDPLMLVSSNGSQSTNNIDADILNNSSIFQGADSSFNAHNSVNAHASAGKNTASYNTGSQTDGEFSLFTGNAMFASQVITTGGVNLFGNGLTLPWGMELNFGFDLNPLMGLFV